MKLSTPVTGTVIEVADENAQLYISHGFKTVEPKKPARKRTTKKEK